jgi:hypothetical protein
VNCQWSDWSEFSSCSEFCGGGTKSRTRSKVVEESNGGSCSGSNNDTISCNTGNCTDYYEYNEDQQFGFNNTCVLPKELGGLGMILLKTHCKYIQPHYISTTS